MSDTGFQHENDKLRAEVERLRLELEKARLERDRRALGGSGAPSRRDLAETVVMVLLGVFIAALSIFIATQLP